MHPVDVGQHMIELLPGSMRRKPHSYCIPVAYHSEVDRQARELFDLTLIEYSEAGITYLIVSVASIRMCVNLLI